MIQQKYNMTTDVAIIGAGPAGCSASLFLSKEGIKHVIFDKAQFPRDKICGDGLSGKVVAQIKRLDLQLFKEMVAAADDFLPSWGVRFVAPGGAHIDIPFSNSKEDASNPPGFVAKRFAFDQFLVKHLDSSIAKVCLNSEVINVDITDTGVSLQVRNEDGNFTCSAKMVISAEGDRSMIAKKFARYRLQPEFYFAGLRAYYQNVSDIHPHNFIELHFLTEALPGYFWIFPLPDNQVNVGIGMLSKDIRSKKINLRHLLRRIIDKNPTISSRFKNAVLIDDIKGWGLPLGSVKRKISGQRYLLIGDAGSLIDPFTGEGVGNAMVSGRYAAQAVREAFKTNNFSAEFLVQQYDAPLYQELWSELRLSRTIQRLVRFQWLFDFVINRVSSNKSLQRTFSAMFNDLDARSKLSSPAFYLKLLFNR